MSLLFSSTAPEIVKWVTTADGCVHSADTTQLDFAVGKFVQTRQDCRQLVVNCDCIHTSRRRCVCVCYTHTHLRRDDAIQFDS